MRRATTSRAGPKAPPVARSEREPRPRPEPEGQRERNKREKRERLLRAAGELFEKKGFAGATAREICRRARIGTGTLFLYAQDKRDLLFRVFEDESRRLFSEAAAHLHADDSLLPGLMRLFGAFIDFYAAHPVLAHDLIEQLFLRQHEATGLGGLTLDFTAHVRALVERAQARGEVRADREAEVLAAAFFAHYAFWIQAWLMARSVTRTQAEAALRLALELQLEGARSRKPKETR